MRLWDSLSCFSCPEIAAAFYSNLISKPRAPASFDQCIWHYHHHHHHWCNWVTFLICSRGLFLHSSQSVSFLSLDILHGCDGVHFMWNTMRREDQIRNLPIGPCDLSLAVEVYVRSLLPWLTKAMRAREAMVVRMIWIFRNQASASQSLQLLLCKYADAIPGQFCRRTDLKTNIQMIISCKNTGANYYELLLLHLQQLSHWS